MDNGIFEDRYIKIGDVNTRYWSAGDKGSPVILLHGVGCHIEFWERNVDELSKEHRIFAVDVVGYGKTDKPMVDYTFPFMANFVLDFMKTMGIDKASLVGNSMGGGISMTVASKAPEKVEKVVLVDPVGLGRGLSPVMRLMTAPLIGDVITAPGRKAVILQMQSCLHDPSRVNEDFINRATLINALPGNKRSFLSLLRETANFMGVRKRTVDAFSDCLKKIQSPILVIWGRQDKILPLADAEAAIPKLANGRLHIIDQAGHCPQIDKPEEFNATVLSFLKD